MTQDGGRKPGEPGYDPRKEPNRGVRVPPLPRHVHSEFRDFVDGLRSHAQSHLSTLTLARNSGLGEWSAPRERYWRSVLKYLNTVEYLGTANVRNR